MHIIYRGAMPGKGNKNSTSGVEMYAVARYFTMTGNHLEGTPDTISDGAEALPWIHEAYIAKKKTLFDIIARGAGNVAYYTAFIPE